MITETETYKGRRFTCDNCDYVVSSNAMSDFDVDDFSYCPCCGAVQEEEMSDEHVEKIIMVIERRKQIVNAMKKIIKMLEVVRNEHDK